MSPVDTLRSLGFQEALAVTYPNSISAQVLLRRAGIPVARMPVFQLDPYTYWETVLMTLEKGVGEDCFFSLAKEAHSDFPANPVFQACRDQLSLHAHTGLSEQVRILLLVSNHDKNLNHRTDREVNIIRDAIKGKPRFTFHYEPAVQLENIAAVLAEQQPNVLHISCNAEKEGLVFETRKGERLISAEHLAGFVNALNTDNREPLKYVLCSTCYSDSIAETLAASIDAAIGFEGIRMDRESICFANGFYHAFANGMGVKRSFQMGVEQMKAEEKDRQRTATAVLHTNERHKR